MIIKLIIIGLIVAIGIGVANIVVVNVAFNIIDKLNNQIQQINYFITQYIKDRKKDYPTQEQLDKFINSIYNN